MMSEEKKPPEWKYFDPKNKRHGKSNSGQAGLRRSIIPAEDSLLRDLGFNRSQERIIECMSTGLKIAGVASVLGLHPTSVKFQLTILFKRFKCKGSIQLVVYLARAGYYNKGRVK